MFLLHKGICTFNATSIKIPVAFTELEKTRKHTIQREIVIIRMRLRYDTHVAISDRDFNYD